MGELLGAFAFASDLAFGLHLEDSLRSCYVAMRIADHLGLSGEDRMTVYYTALLKDAGCTSWTSELARIWQTDEIVARRELWIFSDRSSYAGLEAWLHQYVAPDLPMNARQAHLQEVMAGLPQTIAEAITTTAEVAGRIAMRLRMPPSVQAATLHLFEQWDGSGAPDGLKATEIPIASRIVLPTFVVVPVNRIHGRESSIAAVQRSRDTTFDPDVINALDELSRTADFWAEVEADGIHERVLAMEPLSALSDIDAEGIEDIAFAFADFIDLKSRFAAAHSRRVARIAEELARLMGCAPEAVVQIRRAALMHDLGLVAIPSYSLEKPENELTQAEWEHYRLHPYHGERILQRVPALAPFAEMVGNHQERFDGSGYYRGLGGQNVSLGARVIGVADRLDELTHSNPTHPSLALEDALAQLSREPFDPAIIAALRQGILREAQPEAAVKVRERPAGLTDREIEVLVLAAQGLTRRAIAERLGISENTIRHHLGHVYSKTGSYNRVTATLFAMENGLLA